MSEQILQLNRRELNAELRSIYADMLRDAEKRATEKMGEALKTPEQTSEQLHVSIPTLWRWQQRGYLCPIYIGGKKRYRQSDINRIIEEGGVE